MAAALPPDTRVDRMEGGLRLSLPARPLGSGRLVGLFLVPFGAVFAGGPLTGGISALDGGCLGVLFLLFTLPFVVAGLGLFSLGLWFLFPRRTTFVLGRDRLGSTERFGPFWWTRSVPRAGIRGFQVQRTGARNDAALAVEVEGRSSPFVMGQSYPSEWLEGLAQALAETHGSAAVAPTVETAPVPAVPARAPASAGAQPAGSDILLEYTADSVRLNVPRKGIWKANGCLLLFGIVWSGFSGFMFVAMLAGAIGGERGAWGGVAFLLIFVAVGAGLLLGAIHSGIKSSTLVLSGASFAVRKTGVFGRNLQQWPRKSIQSFSVEDSGWEVNDVRQWQLRVDLADAKPLKLLRGRSTEELEWIASALRSGPLGRVETVASEVKGAGAECQVCNSPMNSDIVYCSRCRTPHHGQCWQYLGQCSTYGCREIRYTTS